jgi:hypothetical protein
MEGNAVPRGNKMSARLKFDPAASAVLPAPVPEIKVGGWVFAPAALGLFRIPRLSAENAKKTQMKGFPRAVLAGVTGELFVNEYKKFVEKQPVRFAFLAYDLRMPLTHTHNQQAPAAKKPATPKGKGKGKAKASDGPAAKKKKSN